MDVVARPLGALLRGKDLQGVPAPAAALMLAGTPFAPQRAMKKKPASRRRPAEPATARPAESRPSEEDLQGPPPREATIVRGDRERRFEEDLAEHPETSPALAGGDLDADWHRAATVGEEAVGGSVATPDQDVVDELGDALGVGRAPDEEVRTSDEILEERDRRRWEQEP